MRAYATNSQGTAYGAQVYFVTLPSTPCGTTVTYEGKTYNTVQIGNQCWFKQNLNVGTRINGSQTQQNNGIKEKYCYNDLESNCNIYGGLYQWNEIMQFLTTPGAQGICPTGWRIPASAEWNALSTYLGGYSVAGGKMKSPGITADGTGLWLTPNTGATNESGFTGLPGGGYLPGQFFDLTKTGEFWSSTDLTTVGANTGHLYYYDANFAAGGNPSGKTTGFSGRCVREAGAAASAPTVTTTAVTGITQTTATSGGNVTADGGLPVTTRGVCWGTASNPAVTGNHTTDGNGTGVFTSSLTNLTAGTTYYVRAYATNGAGTYYGSNVSFSTLAGPGCGNTFTINHAAGTVAPVNKSVTYSTVSNVPGEPSKCWVTSNLGSDHAATAFIDDTEASAGWYWQFNRKQGYKHDGTNRIPNYAWTFVSENSDWIAANDPCAAELGGTWRIPTAVEWTNVNLAGNWDGGNDPWTSLLKLHGAGYLTHSDATLAFRGQEGLFWCRQQTGDLYAGSLDLYVGSSGITDSYKAEGHSLRCVRDGSGTPTVPTVTTSAATSIGLNSAVSGGNVTSDGGASVTARGVCWSTASNPTNMGSHTTDGSGAGVFVSNITGLAMNTLYYIRAYATNIVGTAYGTELSFTTLSPPPCGSSITIDHGAGAVAPVIKTVTYGTVANIPGELTKCWITSNLGADHQAIAVDDATEASAGWYWQFNRKQGYKHDGTTRTPNTTWISSIIETSDWTASNDPCTLEIGGGWRIPTTTEWTNIDASGNWVNWNGPWNSGLKLHVAGYLLNTNGSLLSRGVFGWYWSSSQFSSDFGWLFYFRSGASSVLNSNKTLGCNLRCTKELLPTVTTTAVSNITQTAATSGGNITSDGGSTVTERGLCWGTSANPTITGGHTSNGSGTGTFVSNLTGLNPNTLYYVRAYATNSSGTAYGNQISFTTLSISFNIGQSYGGGIIFYIDGSGQHGLISATSDQSTGSQWGCWGTSISGTSTIIGAGQANTTLIVNGCSETAKAARICNDLSLNGYDDWFLPSKDELNLMYAQRIAIGGFLNSSYWSSSESSAYGAWDQYFANGGQSSGSKNNTDCVRAVRAF